MQVARRDGLGRGQAGDPEAWALHCWSPTCSVNAGCVTLSGPVFSFGNRGSVGVVSSQTHVVTRSAEVPCRRVPALMLHGCTQQTSTERLLCAAGARQSSGGTPNGTCLLGSQREAHPLPSQQWVEGQPEG